MSLDTMLTEYRNGDRPLPTYSELATVAKAQELMEAALRTILELSANAPGRGVFADIAFEALSAAR